MLDPMSTKEGETPPKKSPPPLPSKSFALVVSEGLSRSYGQAVKASFPPLTFSDDPVKVESEQKEDGFHISMPATEEWRLAQPFRWVVRGIFMGRRKSILAIDKAIQQEISLRGPFQVSPSSSSEVLIRCRDPEDAIRILCRSGFKIEGAPIRFLRWSPLSPNLHLTYTWCYLRGIPPHFGSIPALQAILQNWATVLAVDQDARFLTRPEVIRVFIEINAKDLPPKSFYLHGLGGTTKISLELQRVPILCAFCKKIGHREAICRARLRNANKFPRNNNNYSEICGKKSEQIQLEKSANLTGEAGTSMERTQIMGHNAENSDLAARWHREGKFCREKFPCNVNWQKSQWKEKCKDSDARDKKTLNTKDINSLKQGVMIPRKKEKFFPKGNNTHTAGENSQIPTDAQISPDIMAPNSGGETPHSGGITTEIQKDGLKDLEDASSPAASDIQITPFKPWGPMLWSSMAGDIHLNYAMCNEETVKNNLVGIPFDRRPNVSTKDFNKPLLLRRLKRSDPKYTCRSCSVGMVGNKGSMCMICAFKGPKRSWGNKTLHRPPIYAAKSEECFFTKSRVDEMEAAAKIELLKVAEKELEQIKNVAAKKRENPPTSEAPTNTRKMTWGDITTEDESSTETFQDAPTEMSLSSQDEVEDGPTGRGKKINSRINTPKKVGPRKTRSGRNMDHKEDESRERWIEGIRLLKVKHFDQRHNTTWHKWQVAPEVTISRKNKKRIEDIAHRSESS